MAIFLSHIIIALILFDLSVLLSSLLRVPTHWEEEELATTVTLLATDDIVLGAGETGIDNDNNLNFLLKFDSESENMVCILSGMINQFCSTYFCIMLCRVNLSAYQYVVQKDNFLFFQRYFNRSVRLAVVLSLIMTLWPVLMHKNDWNVYGFNGGTCLLMDPSLRMLYTIPILFLLLLNGCIIFPTMSATTV